MADPDWEDVDPDALMRAAKQHDWMTESRFKRMFEEIEDKLQGVLGTGQYDWVDRRVFDAVFDRSTLMSLHKLMQAGDSYVVEGNTRLFLSTGNAGGLTVVIGTDDPLSMGDIGEIVRDLPLVTEKLRKSL